MRLLIQVQALLSEPDRAVIPLRVIIARLIAVFLVVLAPPPFSLTSSLVTVRAANNACECMQTWSVWVQSTYPASRWPSYCGCETEIDYLQIPYLTQGNVYCGCARSNEHRLASPGTRPGESA